MNRIRFFSSLIGVAIYLAACAPAATAVSAIQPTSLMDSTSSSAQTTVPASASLAVTPSPMPIATSRGPELHASDPATVKLASGGLQLVEFFRFT